MLSRPAVFLFAVLGAGAAVLSGCEGQKPAATAEAPAASATAPRPAAPPVAEARYACPMGCAGSESAQPGKCPTCGMALEKKS